MSNANGKSIYAVPDVADAKPPACECGKAKPGDLGGGHLKDDPTKARLTIHMVDKCASQDFDGVWFKMFMDLFFLPAQNERTILAQQLACVLHAAGGQVRFNMKETLEAVAPTGFKVNLEPPDPEGFVVIKSPASRLVLATSLPTGRA